MGQLVTLELPEDEVKFKLKFASASAGFRGTHWALGRLGDS